MRCTLIRPAAASSGYNEGTQECLGIGYVGAALRRAGHAVTVVDGEVEQLDDDAAFARAAAADPQLVGFSILCDQTTDSLARLAGRFRRSFPDAHLTVGGNLPSFAPEWVARLAPDLDSVIRFEGEQPLVELADRLESGRGWADVPGLCSKAGGWRANPAAKPADDMDALPFPLRDTLPAALEQGWMPPLSTSRGCVGKCSFCAVHKFNLDPDRPWRFRSPANVADEIERLVVDHAVREVNFVDDDFVGNRRVGQPRARDLSAELRRRGLDVGFSLQCRAEWIDRDTFRPLKDAGLQMVFFGIEAVDPHTRRVFKKGQTRDLILRALALLKELDVYTHVGFIMFNPWTRLEDVRDAVGFLREIGHLNIHTVTNILQLSPGTPLLDPLLADGTAFRDPTGSYRWAFADPRVSALKAVFDRTIWPHFPRWYESLMAKWSVMSRQYRARAGGGHESLLERMDDVVYEVAVRAVAALEEDPRADLFALTRELGAFARGRLAGTPALPPLPYAKLPQMCDA